MSEALARGRKQFYRNIMMVVAGLAVLFGLNYLVQSFLFSGDRGAAAVLGASTLTDSASEALLGKLLMPRLVTPGMSMGQALQDAKHELALTHPELLDVLLCWSLMGDPALVIEP